jgi:hypothetical protein
MTSNATKVPPTKSLFQSRRKNPFVKLFSAARPPLSKLIRSCSGLSASTTSSATESTNQDVALVRFSEKNHICKTLSRMSYTLEEYNASWWSCEDLQEIARRCEKEIKKIEDGMKFKDKKYCARGLEGQTRIGSVSKEQNRALAINAVLDEQWTQWHEGIFHGEDTIAEVYCRASSSCQLRARIVGRRDEIHRASYGKASAPRCHHYEQTTKSSNDAGLEQSLVAPRAA